MIKFLLLIIFFILLGYWAFQKWEAPVEKLQMDSSEPLLTPDYSDQDRKQLDSILNDVNP